MGTPEDGRRARRGTVNRRSPQSDDDTHGHRWCHGRAPRPHRAVAVTPTTRRCRGPSVEGTHDGRRPAGSRGQHAVRRALRGRQAAPGDDPPARPRAEATHPRQPRRPAVRRRPVGPPRPPAARRVRRPAPRPRRRGPVPRGRCSPRRSPTPTPASGCSTAPSPSFTVGAGMSDEIRAYLDEVDPVTLADHLIGGLTVREAGELLKGKGDPKIGTGAIAKGSPGRSSGDGADDFVLRPLPNSYFTRDPSRLDLRRRRRQPDVLAGPPPRGAQRRDDLPLPPRLPRRRLQVLVLAARTRARSFGRVSSEGGDIMPIGNRTVAIGMSERTTGQMIEKIALALFKAGRRGPRHRRRHDPRPGAHAPRHGVHVPRPRRRDDVPQGRELDHRLLASARRTRRARSR